MKTNRFFLTIILLMAVVFSQAQNLIGKWNVFFRADPSVDIEITFAQNTFVTKYVVYEKDLNYGLFKITATIPGTYTRRGNDLTMKLQPERMKKPELALLVPGKMLSEDANVDGEKKETALQAIQDHLEENCKYVLESLPTNGTKKIIPIASDWFKLRDDQYEEFEITKLTTAKKQPAKNYGKYQYKDNYEEGLARVRIADNKWGFVDKAGKVVIPCQFHFANNFHDGLARIQDKDLRFGYIDKSGKEVLPSQWYDAEEFSGGVAFVMNHQRLWGLVDKSGKLLCPYKFKEKSSFVNGWARVKLPSGYTQFIDRTGKIVITDQRTLCDNLYCVKDANGKYGYMNKYRRIVISCQWEDAEMFSEGRAAVQDANKKWGYIDLSGKVLTPCQFNYAEKFCNGMARVKGEDDQKTRHDLWGYVNKEGKLVVPCQWKEAKDFSDGMGRVTSFNYKNGFVDMSGKLVIPCILRDADNFSEGLAGFLGDNGKWGYIDKTGKQVLPCQWFVVGFFKNGIAAVEITGKAYNKVWRKINKKGEEVE